MILQFRFLALALIASLLSSCFKKDDPVVLPPPGDVQVSQVSMGPDYYNQIYFQLSTKNIKESDHRFWDLAFESSSSGYHVWVNGGNQILVSNTNSSDFTHVTDTIFASWKWDASSWNPDSTAIGDWTHFVPTNPTNTKYGVAYSNPGKNEETEDLQTGTTVYILDLGPDATASERFKKIVFETVSATQYTFRYANLDGTNQHEILLQKNSAFAYKYFSIRNGDTEVFPEPVKSDWDIQFTRYRYIFYQSGQVIPYLVSGVLVNPDGYSVAVDTTKSFSDIDYNFAKDLVFINGALHRDVIGWNWKHFNFSTSIYEVNSSKNYIIKDKIGYYWKLHFIGFYNDQGVKGYPQFEFQRL